MVIQRIQTIYLILAIALTAIFLCVPFGYLNIANVADGTTITRGLKACAETGLLVPSIVAMVLAFVAIFLFKAPQVQKTVVMVTALISVAIIITVVYTLVSGYTDVTPGMQVVRQMWGGGGLLMVAAFICELMAYKSIASDIRLLKSANSLR